MGPQSGRLSVGQGKRRVQPLRPAGGRADRGDQRRQYLVHRTGAGRPPGRRAQQSGECRADAGGDPRPAGCRHRDRTRRRPAGSAGGGRADQHPQPAQSARAGADWSGHPGRARTGGDRRAARLTRYVGPAAGGAWPAIQPAGAPTRRGRGRGATHRGEFQHPGGARGFLSDNPAHRVRPATRRRR